MADFWKNLFANHSKESRINASNALQELANEDGDEVEDSAVEAVSDSTQNQPEAPELAAADNSAMQALVDKIATLESQLAGMKQEQATAAESQAATLSAEASKWARAQVEENRLLPADESKYAQAYEKLAAMCSAAIEAKEYDAVYVSTDNGLGVRVDTPLITIFTSLVEKGAQHGWTDEVANEPADHKVTFNKTDASEPQLAADGTRVFSDQEVKAIVAQALGKKAEKASR